MNASYMSILLISNFQQITIIIHVHVLMRDKKEKIKINKQGQTNNKAEQRSTPKAVTACTCTSSSSSSLALEELAPLVPEGRWVGVDLLALHKRRQLPRNLSQRLTRLSTETRIEYTSTYTCMGYT